MNLTRRVFCLLLAGLATGAVVAAQDDLDKAPRIAMAEFKRLHQSAGVLVVDVRNADSFKEGRIPGAVSVPLPSLTDPQRIAELRAAKKPIVTYCA